MAQCEFRGWYGYGRCESEGKHQPYRRGRSGASTGHTKGVWCDEHANIKQRGEAKRRAEAEYLHSQGVGDDAISVSDLALEYRTVKYGCQIESAPRLDCYGVKAVPTPSGNTVLHFIAKSDLARYHKDIDALGARLKEKWDAGAEERERRRLQKDAQEAKRQDACCGRWEADGAPVVCATCRYGVYDTGYSHTEALYECRRFPPQSDGFPLQGAMIWCGEWEEGEMDFEVWDAVDARLNPRKTPMPACG